MTWAATSNPETHLVRRHSRFVSEVLRTELTHGAASEGLLVVDIDAPTPAARGRLALVMESAIEDALERRGASPPGVGASSDLDATLSDQLYRARQVGKSGLCLSLGTLAGVANLAGALDAEDSAVLRWWLAATEERPVRLLLSDDDRHLAVYDEPTALSHIVGELDEPDAPAESGEKKVVLAAPEVAQSSATMELSEAPPAVEAIYRDVRGDDAEEEAVSSDADALAQAMAALFDEHVDSSDERELSDEDDALVSDALGSRAPQQAEPEASEPAPEADADPVVEAAEPEPPTVVPEPSLADTEAAPEPEVDWRTWMMELSAARGPKPLAVVERMFVSAYVPLADAVARGLADDDAREVLETWSQSFAKSYSEAFDALRVRGKRPTMVLDVPDIALRMGRLHGARSIQLVLVDGMRFDLGLRVNDRIKMLVGGHAALTERLLLWSALPSTTEVQVELIGKGPAGLKEIGTHPDSEIPVARGRAAATLRRIRTGQRELLKLDIVESALSVPGAPISERLDALADEAAEAIANHLMHLPPRTLVLVFGDHGFTVDAMGNGTSAGDHGGASPDEVLVPAFSWLVGAVH